MMSVQAHNALDILAKRSNKKAQEWLSIYINDNCNDLDILPHNDYRCCICNLILDRTEIEYHGLNHLKNSGLLVFL